LGGKFLGQGTLSLSDESFEVIDSNPVRSILRWPLLYHRF
jgi:hypothetical protein